MESNNDTRQDSPHFGAALQELEQIVDRIEGQPDLSLDEVLGLYERGAALANRCRTLLSAATLRVSQVDVEREAEERTEPVQRRVATAAAQNDADERVDHLVFGALEMLPAERQVLVSGREVALTRTEFDLLLALVQAQGRVMTRDELVVAVWGDDSEGDTRRLDSHILHLRGKIEAQPRRPRFVLTVRDIGYRLNRQPS